LLACPAIGGGFGIIGNIIVALSVVLGAIGSKLGISGAKVLVCSKCSYRCFRSCGSAICCQFNKKGLC
jgi:hypothetical protein